MKSEHLLAGNCWKREMVYNCAECGQGNLCDVCHEHDEARGDCSECTQCLACEEEEAAC